MYENCSMALCCVELNAICVTLNNVKASERGKSEATHTHAHSIAQMCVPIDESGKFGLKIGENE